MNILDLPPELLTVCLSYLRGTDLATVSRTCTILNDISDFEKLWKNRCHREYGLDSVSRWNGTFKEVYRKVLHKYGKIVGLWRNKSTCYGGLVHVWYTDEGEVMGEEYYGQAVVQKHLLRKPLFRITLDTDKNVNIEWLAYFNGPKPCTLTLHHKTTESLKTFTVDVMEPQDAKRTSQAIEQEKELFLEECYVRGTQLDLRMYKWQSYKKHRYKHEFERLEAVQFEHVNKVPIQPGLFKGMYGGHGTEIIHLYYTNDTTGLAKNTRTSGFAKKISGDPNVPSGETSGQFYLDQQVIPPTEQQLSLSMPDRGDSDTHFPYGPEQPFSVPPEMLHDSQDVSYPKRCIARFHAKGTVSPMGYRNPTLIDTHFIVFHEDLFGIMWMELDSFSLFARVEEKFDGLRRLCI